MYMNWISSYPGEKFHAGNYGRHGLLEYVDNAALVQTCQLAPELADQIMDQFDRTCSPTIQNPRYDSGLILE